MEKINFILFFLLILLNINLDYGQEVQIVYPSIIQLIDGGHNDIILTFNQSMEFKKYELTLNHSTTGKCFKLTGNISNPADTKKIFFYFDYDRDFINPKFETGNYYIYFNSKKTANEDKILIYKFDISFMEPTIRYFLDDGIPVIRALFQFSESDISVDQIKAITYTNDENSTDKGDLTNSNYSVAENGKALNIIFKRAYNVAKYTFKLYPSTDENTENYVIFHIYFQDFEVKYEAVYFNELVNSAIGTLKIEFKPNTFDKNVFSLKYSNEQDFFEIQNKSFTPLVDNTYWCYFSIDSNPLPGNITINYKYNGTNQERSIYLITYKTTGNKCYLEGENGSFFITFSKIKEMKFPHSVYFNLTNGSPFTSSDSGTNTPSYRYNRLNLLTPGIYGLYSRISSLNYEENNPIDNSSLIVRIYGNPNLKNETIEKLYTGFNEPQFIYLNMTGADNVNEVFLYNNERIITFYLDQSCIYNEAEKIYKCNFSYLEDIYDGNYFVNYTSVCDNKKLKIEDKIVTIEKGIYLKDIEPKYCYLDNVKSTSVDLTFTSDININSNNSNINIFFCINETNCFEQVINQTNIPSTSTLGISELTDLENCTYYIKTTINGQTIHNKNIKFKVLNRLKFNFNHHYFVQDDSIINNYLYINKDFSDNNIICAIQDDQNRNLSNQEKCNNFSYEINKASLGEIRFSYLDGDINVFIPIDDEFIYIADNINQLLSFDKKSCYYYDFSLSTKFESDYTFTQRIFLVINNGEIIELNRNETENIFELNETNKLEILSLLGENLEIFISEGEIDRNTYLYKSNIIFSNISVPEYVINPNRVLSFTDISCNLCNSKFKMVNDSTRIINLNTNCIYYQNNKSMTIQGELYNYLYRYYEYSVDEKTIRNNSGSTLKTFVSINLNNADFSIKITDRNETFLKIEINNINQEFYFKLISDLVIHKLINSNIDRKIILNRTNSSYNSYEYQIDESSNTISFILEKGNYDLYFDYITRKKEVWENVENNTLYYFFDEIHPFTYFKVSPSVFAFHSIKDERKSFYTNITFNNSALLESLKNSMSKICSNYSELDNITINCTLNTSFLTENKAYRNIYDLSDNPIIIDFIYYKFINTMN